MRIVYLDTYISNICLHIVGNKIADEGLLFSILPTELNSNIKKILTIYFIILSHPKSIINSTTKVIWC